MNFTNVTIKMDTLYIVIYKETRFFYAKDITLFYLLTHEQVLTFTTRYDISIFHYRVIPVGNQIIRDHIE